MPQPDKGDDSPVAAEAPRETEALRREPMAARRPAPPRGGVGEERALGEVCEGMMEKESSSSAHKLEKIQKFEWTAHDMDPQTPCAV